MPTTIETAQQFLTAHLAAEPEKISLAWGIQDEKGTLEFGGAPGRFRIASMTKSFTAATVLAVLAETPKTHLDTPLGEVVPEAHSSLHPITLEQLLSMKSGLPTDDPWADRLEEMTHQQFTALIGREMIFAQPAGTGYEYANLNYALLARAIENLTGNSFRELMHTRVLAPLNLTDTGFAPQARNDVTGFHPDLAGEYAPAIQTGYGSFSPIGGLYSTAADVLSWARHLREARNRTLAGEKLTGLPKILAELQNPQTFFCTQTLTNPPGTSFEGYGFGLHYRWDNPLGEFLYHSGGYPGFGSHMCWHTSTGLSLVLLGARTYFPAETIIRKLILELFRTSIEYRVPTSRAKAGSLPRYAQPPQLVRDNLSALFSLNSNWDDDVASQVLSPNMFQDYSASDLRIIIARVGKTEMGHWISPTEYRLVFDDVYNGPHSTCAVIILFTALGQVQKISACE